MNKSPQQDSDCDALVTIAYAPLSQAPEFSIPARPRGFGNAKWIPFGQSCTVAGVVIPDGMVYVGTSLFTPNKTPDPGLIDPSKNVLKRKNQPQASIGEWPSYVHVNPECRYAYLTWLAGGRKEPDADVGFVFLFLYGLERRVVIDTVANSDAHADVPVIAAELRRLIGLYGHKSQSLRRCIQALLDWMVLIPMVPSGLYLQAIPRFDELKEVPITVRLAAGQALMAGKKVPPSVALEWVRRAPNIKIGSFAKRFESKFDEVFIENYYLEFNGGLDVDLRPSRVEFVYQPASTGVRGRLEVRRIIEAFPDVCVAVKEVSLLQNLVDGVISSMQSSRGALEKRPLSQHEPRKLVKSLKSPQSNSLNNDSQTLAALNDLKAIESPVFELNAERIAAIQAETHKVSEILSRIFVEDVAPAISSLKVPERSDARIEEKAMLLALDDAHAKLASRIMERSIWSRAALLGIASEFGLMLDGALEHINDAAFDAYDMILCEGDGSVMVNTDIVGRLQK